MKKLFIVNFVIFFLIGCELFVTELPWASGYYAEVPGKIDSITRGYSDDGTAMILTWEPIPRASNYIVNYTINSVTYTETIRAIEKQISIGMDSMWAKGINFSVLNDMTVEIIAANNVGNSDQKLTTNVKPLGSGTASDPYVIFNSISMNNYVAIHIGTAGVYGKLISDLDLGSNATYLGDTVAGVFDGDGHTITYSSINSDASDKSLFTEISGTVKNLKIYGTREFNNSADNTVRTGLLAGLNSGTITNCEVLAGSSAKGYQGTGLLVGENTGNIINCSVDGNVSVTTAGTPKITGGLVGYNMGLIENCTSTGIVDGYATVGGLIGSMSDSNARVISSSSSADVHSANSAAGGFVGSLSLGLIEDCFSTGAVVSDSIKAGGFAAQINCNEFADPKASIVNCYSTGNVQCGYEVGGFIGFTTYGIISDCNSNSDIITTAINNRYGLFGGYMDSSTVINCIGVGTLELNGTLINPASQWGS